MRDFAAAGLIEDRTPDAESDRGLSAMVRNRQPEQRPADTAPARLSHLSGAMEAVRDWLARWFATRSRFFWDWVLGRHAGEDARLGETWGAPGAFDDLEAQ